MQSKLKKNAKRGNRAAPPVLRTPTLEKLSLHPRNRHRGRYDFAQLVAALPALDDFLIPNPFDPNERTIDFANAEAVMALNAALLKSYYGVDAWRVPPGYLCPPIPGRADYIHHVADLLAADHRGIIPRGADVRVLDIGTGANCIYPLIGHAEYGWRFVGTDVDAAALRAAQATLDHNPSLVPAITLRRQAAPQKIFAGIMQPEEHFDFVLCNPPFHASAHDAALGAVRKWKNLGRAGSAKKVAAKPALNFGGQAAELWCEGGEAGFVSRMVTESASWRAQVSWFSALVSQEKNLPAIYAALRGVAARRVETINMAQGQKKSRIVAWQF
jgi:23S rRNA (adenine1618-N6)-methyltransferase